MTNKVLYAESIQTTLNSVKKQPASVKNLQGKDLDVFKEFKKMDVIE